MPDLSELVQESMIDINYGSLSIIIFIALWKNSLENVRATIVNHKRMADMNSIDMIGKSLSLVKAIILQHPEGGEFLGGKNDKVKIQFQKPPESFSEEYGINMWYI